jgi:putative oxidoreductase
MATYAMEKRSDSIPLMVGRAIFGGFFLYNGINHFLQREQLSGYAGSKGVPAANVAVEASGALMTLGGLSLLTGYKPKLGSAMITMFLAGVTPSMHRFWSEQDPERRQAEMINFMKNVALIGGAMLAAGRPEPWPVSAAASGAA